MKGFWVIFFLGPVILACNRTISPATGQAAESSAFNAINSPEQAVSLADHLRKVPGINVQGEGASAKVTIRGKSSIYSGTEPLFVVNGQPLNGGLSAANNMIPVNEISSIRVLKTPSEVGMYGVRGANGVIVITLK